MKLSQRRRDEEIEGESEGKRGKCPTSNNADLIKEMTHLLHASAFS